MIVDNVFVLFFVVGTLTGVALVATAYAAYCWIWVIRYRRQKHRRTNRTV